MNRTSTYRLSPWIPFVLLSIACGLAQAKVPFQDNPGFITPVPGVQTVGAPKPPASDAHSDYATRPIKVNVTVENATFHEIRLEGNTALSEKEISELTAPYLNHPLNEPDLFTLADAFNQLFKKKGYITSYVSIQEQNIETGSLVLTAHEGRIESIRVKDPNIIKQWAAEGVFKAQNKTEKPFNLNVLKDEISLIAKQNPYRLNARVVNDIEQPEVADLVLERSEPTPWQVSPTVDDQGRPNIGIFRSGITLANQNLLGIGDNVVSTVVLAKGTVASLTNYTFPIGPRGDTLSANVITNNVDANIKGEKRDLEGNTYTYGFTLAHPWDRRRILTTTLNYNFRQNRSTINERQDASAKTHFAVIGTNFNKPDKFGSTYARVELALGTANVTKNRGIWRSSMWLQRQVNLPLQNQLFLKGFCQLTSDTLPIAQDLQLGGAYSVRGYTEGLIEGDKGYTVSLEDRFPIPYLSKVSPWLGKRLQGAVFLDAGQALTNKTSPRFLPNFSNRTRNSFLIGTGFGLRFRLTQYLMGFLDTGFGLVDRSYLETNAQPTARIHFGIRSDLIPQRFN